MLTYNETIEGIKKVLSEEFEMEFNEFFEEIVITSLGFSDITILEEALIKEFNLSIPYFSTLYDSEATFGDIANEIMEDVNYSKLNEEIINTGVDSESESNFLYLFAITIIVAFIYLILH